MLRWVGYFSLLVVFAMKPWILAVTVAAGVLLWLILRALPTSSPAASATAATEPPRTADGRFPLLNEDWAGEVVHAIDDPEIPAIIRRHGARLRNPARYAIDLGQGEYLLYGADGELLDLCWLK